MGETHEVQITAVMSAEIDVDRVEEYVQTNFSDGDQIQIFDAEDDEILYDNVGSETL